MARQMKLIAEMMGDDLKSLPRHEREYKEGDTGELRLYVRDELDEGMMRTLDDQLLAQGVVLTGNIRQDSGVVAIRFKKMLAPLAILAIVIGSVVGIAGLLLGWQIFRTMKEGVPGWVWILGLAAATYLVMTSQPAKVTGRAAVGAGKWAGKTYISKKIPGGSTTSNLQLPLWTEGDEEE